MERGKLSGGVPEKLRKAAEKYKYAIAVALLGVFLMLLPTGGVRGARSAPEPEARASVQAEWERALAAFEGVGRLHLVLRTEPETQSVTGALVVCEGADSAKVRLELTRALGALTGLSSEKIAIVKGKP